MSSQTQGNNLQDFLKYEEENNYSREVVGLKAAENLALGTVIGKILLGTCPATGTASSPITGAGTCTGVTAGAKAKVGTYTLQCIIAAAGAGIFTVEDPDGLALPNAITGVGYVNDQINFTLNDGSPDFAVGDAFTITIAEGAGTVAEINFDAVDGTQNAHGIVIADYDATNGSIDGVAIVRDAMIVADNLVWPTTSPAVSAAQKAAALAQLAAKGIIEVTDV